MELVVQVVVGLLLLPLVGFITYLVFSVLTALVNLPVLALARTFRKVFHVRGHLGAGAAVGEVLVFAGKGLCELLVPLSVFVYVFWPESTLSGWLLVVAVAALVIVWMPGVFVLAFCSERFVERN